jgi:SAM-dependent methyltransferase
VNPQEYDLMRQVEDQHWWYCALRAQIADALAAHEPNVVADFLDVGCGTGGLLDAFRARAKWTGLDYAPEAIEHCRARSLVALIRGSAESLPIDAEQFDGITCMDLLYHQAIRDPAETLQEFHRVLRPEGLLLINVPAYRWLESAHDHAIHTARRFTREGITDLVSGEGFEVLRARYWNILLFPPIAAVRLLKRNQKPQTSDLKHRPLGPINDLLAALLRIERRLPAPFGLSIFVVALKRG